MTSRAHISITAQTGQAELSAPQKKFNTLVQKIAAQRKLLGDWQEAIPLFQQRRARELDPLLAKLDGVSTELVAFLDGAYAQKGLSKTDRSKLAGIICDLADTLMQGDRAEAMKAIYNKYSATDFDTEAREAQQAMKTLLEEDLGIELGDEVDMDSPEAVMRALHAQMEAEQARMDHIAAEKEKHRSQHRKKSAREIKQQAAEKDASQSLREVYRKLASALHPDRETDPAERARKTALMQRVNQAYANKNLLDMLQLQIEAEQIDPERMANLSAERLRHYNQVLTDQLRELQQEVKDTELSFKRQFGIAPMEKVTPANMMSILREQVQWLAHDIHQMKNQLAHLDDLKTLKLWIRTQVQRSADFDAFGMDEDFDFDDYRR
ncbi:hypothetical protein RD110_24160 [Rhodoferax koreense]|uniref:Molecular chaperone DnaJ n=1 Tax=Rhodoferax koreensis TaxID=1842727 RepID=A0A1P8K1P5_9BURK|nr:hypothetical protein [Rhodoferax koreense]APW39915.1 hypothetical protein RD110_24160 [Rhodoferax koreense]